MFTYSIDNKPTVVDNNGNQIVDLAHSMFAKNSDSVNLYDIKKMSSYAVMRPDLVAISEYGNVDYTEYILKFTGICNPFALDDDDILMIPNTLETEAKMWANSNEIDNDESSKATLAAIRNYFKFVNQDYKKDSTSYDELANTKFESQIPSDTLSGDYVVPYITDGDLTAITIRNGRIYFGEDSGLDSNSMITATTTNIDEKILAIVDSTASALSDSNCLYNGVTLADFIRASTSSSGTDAETELANATASVLSGNLIS